MANHNRIGKFPFKVLEKMVKYQETYRIIAVSGDNGLSGARFLGMRDNSTVFLTVYFCKNQKSAKLVFVSTFCLLTNQLLTDFHFGWIVKKRDMDFFDRRACYFFPALSCNNKLRIEASFITVFQICCPQNRISSQLSLLDIIVR